MSSLNRKEFLKLAFCAALTPLTLKLDKAFSFSKSSAPRILSYGQRTSPYVALTIDDCYSYPLLQKVESLLDQSGIRITFFPTGKALIYTSYHDQGIWKRLLSKGHELGYHGFDHQYPSRQTLKELQADYDLWLEAATKVLGGAPQVRFARPPYGDLSQSFLLLCQDRGLVPTLWTTGWGFASSKFAPVLQELQGGDIILMHLRPEDLEDVQQALPVMRQKNIRAVTLSVLYQNLASPAYQKISIPNYIRNGVKFFPM